MNARAHVHALVWVIMIGQGLHWLKFQVDDIKLSIFALFRLKLALDVWTHTRSLKDLGRLVKHILISASPCVSLPASSFHLFSQSVCSRVPFFCFFFVRFRERTRQFSKERASKLHYGKPKWHQQPHWISFVIPPCTSLVFVCCVSVCEASTRDNVKLSSANHPLQPASQQAVDLIVRKNHAVEVIRVFLPSTMFLGCSLPFSFSFLPSAT